MRECEIVWNIMQKIPVQVYKIQTKVLHQFSHVDVEHMCERFP